MAYLEILVHMFQQADMIASDEFTSQYQKIIFEFIEIKYYKIKKNMEDLILSFFSILT